MSEYESSWSLVVAALLAIFTKSGHKAMVDPVCLSNGIPMGAADDAGQPVDVWLTIEA